MTNKIKFAMLGNSLFAGLIVVTAVLYMVIDCSPYIFKPIASLLFVLCGVFNLIYVFSVLKIRRNIPFIVSMMAGLIFACLGDILLIDHFVIGAGLFAIGHIFFFVSFVCLTGFKLRDFLIGLAIFAVVLCLVLFVPFFDFGDKKILVIAYAFVISFMLGKAVGNVFLTENRQVHLIIMLGALLFFVSDFMLMIYLFGGKFIVFDILCLATYYPAEFLLAFTIFYVATNFNGRSFEIDDIKNMGLVVDGDDSQEIKEKTIDSQNQQ